MKKEIKKINVYLRRQGIRHEAKIKDEIFQYIEFLNDTGLMTNEINERLQKSMDFISLVNDNKI